MRWLDHTSMQSAASEFGGRAPQMITLPADVASLVAEIPIAPVLQSPSEGPPTALYRWFGTTGKRFLELQADASGLLGANSVVIITSFAPGQDCFGDWSALLDLSELPKSVKVSCPLYIESRCSKPAAAVFRRDPKGWNDPVYLAKSWDDAEALLTFLKQDRENYNCFIDNPPPKGDWATLRGEEVLRGYGTELHIALQFACSFSEQYPTSVLQVRDLSRQNSQVFAVAAGKVVDDGK